MIVPTRWATHARPSGGRTARLRSIERTQRWNLPSRHTQQHWYDTAVRFAREQLADAESLREKSAGSSGAKDMSGAAGSASRACPFRREYAGRGEDLPTAVAALEGLGYGCPDAGLVFATAAAMFTVTLPILTFGTDAQKQRFLPGLCAGRLVGANAATEPGAGSDIFAMETRAERRGDRWILNGRKAWITSAPIADLFVCFATTDPSKGVLGISAFLVERGTAGLRTVREISTLGLRTAPLGELVLEDCVVPAENLLGREGRGSSVFNAALEWERGALLAGAVGTMQRQLEQCIEQARSRKQFGQPIGRFQSVSNRIVDMTVRLETSRFLVYRYAWAESQGQDAALWASMAKLHVSECFVQNSLDAVRLFGAAGFSRDNNQERDLRDSVGERDLFGDQRHSAEPDRAAASPRLKTRRHQCQARGVVNFPPVRDRDDRYDFGTTNVSPPGWRASSRPPNGGWWPASSRFWRSSTFLIATGRSFRNTASRRCSHRVALFGVLAVGAAVVIIAGGIDLSTARSSPCRRS